MSMLVTPEMLSAVRAIGETGLQSEVSILRRAIVEGDDGDEDHEVWATTDVVKAWIRQDDRGPVLHVGDMSAVVSSIGRYRIHMEHTVEIDEGDMIGVDGEIFIANEVNNENTIRVFTTVIGRKRD